MAPSSFRVSEPGRGQTTADPAGGVELMMVVVGGEKSRRHRPMVQSSRGWDKAPSSGGGSNHLHRPRGKGNEPLRAALRAQLRGGAGASSPLRSRRAPPRDPRAARPPRRPRAPLLPCPRWLGRDGGWRRRRRPGSAGRFSRRAAGARGSRVGHAALSGEAAPPTRASRRALAFLCTPVARGPGGPRGSVRSAPLRPGARGVGRRAQTGLGLQSSGPRAERRPEAGGRLGGGWWVLTVLPPAGRFY